jgi:hypothetical protein
MRGLVPRIHALLCGHRQYVDGRDTGTFTRVFDALCPAMTAKKL